MRRGRFGQAGDKAATWVGGEPDLVAAGGVGGEVEHVAAGTQRFVDGLQRFRPLVGAASFIAPSTNKLDVSVTVTVTAAVTVTVE